MGTSEKLRLLRASAPHGIGRRLIEVTLPQQTRSRGANRPPPSSAEVSVRMSRQKSRDTRAELALRRALHVRGLRYRLHARPLAGYRAQVDLVFGPSRVAVMVDGCFWHGCPEHGTSPKSNAEWWRAKINRNKERDLATTQALTAAGWMVIRIWEHEDAEQAAARIAVEVERRRLPSVRRTASVRPLT